MKKYFVLFPALAAIVFFGCKNNTVFPPLTTEAVQMGSISEDQITSSASSTSERIASLGSGALNFLDRDSTIISFYYKGTAGSTAPYQLEIYDSTSTGLTSIYTFKDAAATDSLKFISVIMPSHQQFAHYKYRLTASGPTDQSFYIKSLTLYKK